MGPICTAVSPSDLVETLVHGSRVLHPPWLSVSAANRYAGQWCDRTFGNWQSRHIAGRSQLAGSGGAAAMVPVKGKGSLLFSNSKKSAATDESKYFDLVVSTMKVKLEMDKVQCSPIFLQKALTELPDQLSSSHTPADLKQADDKIRKCAPVYN